MRPLICGSNCLVDEPISDQMHKANPQISLEQRNPALLVTDPGFDLLPRGSRSPAKTLSMPCSVWCNFEKHVDRNEQGATQRAAEKARGRPDTSKGGTHRSRTAPPSHSLGQKNTKELKQRAPIVDTRRTVLRMVAVV